MYGKTIVFPILNNLIHFLKTEVILLTPSYEYNLSFLFSTTNNKKLLHKFIVVMTLY